MLAGKVYAALGTAPGMPSMLCSGLPPELCLQQGSLSDVTILASENDQVFYTNPPPLQAHRSISQIEKWRHLAIAPRWAEGRCQGVLGYSTVVCI